jgi:hypothetical protein
VGELKRFENVFEFFGGVIFAVFLKHKVDSIIVFIV